MTLDHVLAAIAIVCFVAALLDRDSGKGVPAGLLFLTLLIVF